MKTATAALVMEPEDAAVFIADESRHPYDWQRILTDRTFYRRCSMQAERNLEHFDLTYLQPRLAAARKALDGRHRL